MKVVYTAVATSTGDGRNGHVRSSDGILDADVRTPPEMGGAGGGTNPEQLFAAGYSACFHSALRMIGRRAKADVDGSEVTAEVGIGQTDSGGFGLKVLLRVSLPKVSRDQAKELVEAAHQVCPYSNATRGNIDVDIEIG